MTQVSNCPAPLTHRTTLFIENGLLVGADKDQGLISSVFLDIFFLFFFSLKLSENVF